MEAGTQGAGRGGRPALRHRAQEAQPAVRAPPPLMSPPHAAPIGPRLAAASRCCHLPSRRF
eukprot:583514-Prymnesium_polylepis.1